MLEIDGSFGEGGGQILRTSLALSLITQTGFRIHNIRRNRAKPGLRRQHLTAVRAAARIGNAELTGDSLNSDELTFIPHEIGGGEYHFDIGSAGSTTLVFQTVLPALLSARRPSALHFTGGTHNHGGPPWDFLQNIFLPVLNRMGAVVTLRLDRHGFAPGGEGRWTANIAPAKLRPTSIKERGPIRTNSVRALVSNLPTSIATRELAIIHDRLPWSKDSMRAETVEATGPGNIVMIQARYDHTAELATGFGRRGVPAEQVALEAVECWEAYEISGAPVGEHLADQLLPVALAGAGDFLTMKPTLHTTTNAEVISKFLPVKFVIQPAVGASWAVSLSEEAS